MKIVNIIGMALIGLSFFWALGSVGAYECDNITFMQCITQVIIDCLVLLAGIGMAEIKE